MNVAVIGASTQRAKFGNKAVRAYAAAGHTVFPVNPGATEIEGIATCASVRDIPVPLDVILVYLPPERTLSVLDDIAAAGAPAVYFNPGSESPEVVAAARARGIDPILACSIVAIGDTPANYSD